MAFGIQIKDRMNLGNVRAVVYKLTDVSSSGSSFESGFTRIRKVQAVNQTDNKDHFKETFSGTTVTLTAVTNNDDGYVMVVGE